MQWDTRVTRTEAVRYIHIGVLTLLHFTFDSLLYFWWSMLQTLSSLGFYFQWVY